MKTYPHHTVLMQNARIVRERRLPSGIYGESLVNAGAAVNATDVVLRGVRPSDYMIIDVAGALGIDHNDEARLNKLIDLEPGQTVTTGELLATPARRVPRRRIPRSPVNAVVSIIQQGRVILQIDPQVVEVQARLSGRVVDVNPGFSVTIEEFGSVIQCAWGNGQFSAAPFDFEPGFDDNEFSGLADLLGLDVSLSPYRGKTIILMRPLEELDLKIIKEHELAGIVAPSANQSLRQLAMRQPFPVLLTEGFGRLPPTSRLYDLLYERRRTPAMFDAAVADTRQNIRPEIIIPGGRRDAPIPRTNVPLATGMPIRIRRAPFAGRIGKITDLPETPIVLENGLRVSGVRVQLQNGDQVMVPRANVESLGEV
jgi:hypothetical protein